MIYDIAQNSSLADFAALPYDRATHGIVSHKLRIFHGIFHLVS
jgi:hypothetical protein